MSPKTRYAAVMLFWIAGLLILFAVRKLLFPKDINDCVSLSFKVAAMGVCFLVGLVRTLDTVYNLKNGVMVSLRGTIPMKVVHLEDSPLMFLLGFMIEAFMWPTLMIITWPALHEYAIGFLDARCV